VTLVPTPTAASSVDTASDRAWWTRLACLVLTALPSERVLHVGVQDAALVEELVARGVDAFGLWQSAEMRPSRCGVERLRTGTLADAGYQAEQFSTVLWSIPAQSAEPAVAELLPALASICTRHALLLVHGHEGHPLDAPAEQRIRERMHRAGFRRHPSGLHFRAHAEQPAASGRRTLILAFERIPASSSPLPIVPPSTPDLLIAPDQTDAEARFLLAAHFINRYDVVIDIACGSGAGAAILHDNSAICARLLAIDHREDAIAYATCAYGAKRPGLSFVHGDIEETLNTIADASADVVVALDQEWIGPDEGDRLIEEARRVLMPNGRLIVALPAASADGSAASLLARLRRSFLIDGVFAQMARTDNRGTALPVIVAVESERDTTLAPSWWIVVAVKDPIAHRTPRPESIEHPRRSLPSVDIAAHSAGFDNPWLPYGIVRIDLRPERSEVLVDMALRTLEQSADGSPDRGAALAVLGYRLLEGHPLDRAQPLARAGDQPLERSIEAFVARTPRTPLEIRWCISNQYLLARLYLRSGDLREAEEAFRRCLSLEPIAHAALLATGDSSCALIATKTVDAAFQAGWLASRRQDRAAARECWTQGIAAAGRAVIDGWPSYTGARITARPYGLHEASAILAAATRCEQGLAWLDLDDERVADLPLRTFGDAGNYRTPMPYVSRDTYLQHQPPPPLSRNAGADVVAMLLTHVSRPIYLWGTGALGRQFAELAGDRLARVTAFVDSAPDKQQGTMLGKPIVAPSVLTRAANETGSTEMGSIDRQRPFVIVASGFAAEILPVLAQMGYHCPDDVFVFPA
jgi:SAM-dependent methyltransferase